MRVAPTRKEAPATERSDPAPTHPCTERSLPNSAVECTDNVLSNTTAPVDSLSPSIVTVPAVIRSPPSPTHPATVSEPVPTISPCDTSPYGPRSSRPAIDCPLANRDQLLTEIDELTRIESVTRRSALICVSPDTLRIEVIRTGPVQAVSPSTDNAEPM